MKRHGFLCVLEREREREREREKESGRDNILGAISK